MKSLLYRNYWQDIYRVGEFFLRYPERWCSAVAFLLGPWAALWMVEILNQNNVFSDLHQWQILMNLIWYYMVFAIFGIIFGRMRPAAAAGIALFFLIGLVNHYVLRFRGRILFPADLAGWKTAANVAEGFDYTPDYYIIQAMILLIAYLFLVWMCPAAKRRFRLPKWLCALCLTAVVGYNYAFFATNMLPNLGIYTQQWVTQANGFVLNFTVAMRYSSVDKPDGYSREAVLELAQEYTGQVVTMQSPPTGNAAVALTQEYNHSRPLNLVVIMNESFADLTMFEGLEPNEDPTPFYHSLTENTVKGWMYSPVTGGGTASVEFEYLTGFSTLFQPPHTVAYQLYVEENMPSLAALAATEGYETYAFHPYRSSGWNRPLAYKYLGFEYQYYEEDVEAPHLIRNYISDLSDYRFLFDITEQANAAGKGTFLFNVTMQNHSGYAQGWNNLSRTIQLSDQLKQADSSAEQYLALMRESDNALEELITYYSQVEEPTMIVFFGDHQPPLKNAFYEALYGKPLSQRTTEEILQQYATPFFIWTNYDSEEADGVILSPNYLGMLTAQTAGLPMTGYMNFLAQLYQELPVITPVGMITADGEYLKKEELSERQQEWLWRYEMLNYSGMKDLFDEIREFYCFHIAQE